MNKLWEKLLDCNAIFVGFVICVLLSIPSVIIAKLLISFKLVENFVQACAISLFIVLIAGIVFYMVGLLVKEVD